MSPSPMTTQTISQSCLNLLVLPLEATSVSSSYASLRSRARVRGRHEPQICESSPLLGERTLLCPGFTDEDIVSQRRETHPGSHK